MFQWGGASLQIIVSKVESAPFHWKESLLRLALKSRGLNGSGKRQELGKVGAGVRGVGTFKAGTRREEGDRFAIEMEERRRN